MADRRGRLSDSLKSLAGDILGLRDELSTLNACNAFVLRALANAVAHEDGMDSREATGAVFCVQWLEDRAAELEARLKSVHESVTSAGDPVTE